MSHELAIARAALLASLVQPCPAAVPHDEIDAFHAMLDTAVSRCSHNSIQREAALVKYLAALSKSFKSGPADNDTTSSSTASPRSRRKPGCLSARRKRLHLLYLLHDVLHHVERTASTRETVETLAASVKVLVADLLRATATCDPARHPHLHRRVAQLLTLWADRAWYGPDAITEFRKTVQEASQSQGDTASHSRPGDETSSGAASSAAAEDTIQARWRSAPYIMPAEHGDPAAPYHELPAACLLPHITPNLVTPIQPSLVKPLHLAAGPADPALVTAMQDFFRDVDDIFARDGPLQREGKRHGDKDAYVDLDELGAVVLRDRATHEIVDGETYYGWSRAFCQQMARKRRGVLAAARDREGASQRRQQDRVRSPRRRRRSYSRSRTRSRSRSRS
ncbi:hypothetical protein KEM52_005090 [Ascosphaera acerosa]|nr:hypothetical protein KEM52_005090 [Ascosphaera acerosa]